VTKRYAVQKAYLERLKARLLAERGGKCERCGSEEILEWAHIKDTGLSGRSRGSAKRYLDVQRNPDSYMLYCHDCHRDFDANRHIVDEYFAAPEQIPF
jgi:hypothetical protein